MYINITELLLILLAVFNVGEAVAIVEVFRILGATRPRYGRDLVPMLPTELVPA